MKSLLISFFIVIVAMQSCNPNGSSGFDNYPAAQPPTLTPYQNLKFCSGNFYVGTYKFDLDIKKHIFEDLSILEDNAEVTQIYSPVPTDNLTSRYYQPDINIREDVANDSVVRPITIFAPQMGWKVGTEITFIFKVRSPNKKYTGTPQEFSQSSLRVRVISSIRDFTCFDRGPVLTSGGGSGDTCVLQLFTAIPHNVKKGDATELNWRISNCEKAQIYENGFLYLELKTDPGQKIIQGTANVKVDKPTVFELRSIGGGTFRTLKTVLVDISSCQDGSSLKPFTYCVSCLNKGAKQSVTINACTQNEAKEEVSAQYGGCTIAPDICPVGTP